jgi:hypothetical protein
MIEVNFSLNFDLLFFLKNKLKFIFVNKLILKLVFNDFLKSVNKE